MLGGRLFSILRNSQDHSALHCGLVELLLFLSVRLYHDLPRLDRGSCRGFAPFAPFARVSASRPRGDVSRECGARDPTL